MRYPPIYEDEELIKWKNKNLNSLKFLRKHCMEFRRHYTGATGCVPSRATLFTGHYGSLHGVCQTTGMAKESFDPDVFWLDPNTIPTMGDYFRSAGYETYYKGKWHITDADILVPGTHIPITTYNTNTGIPDPKYTQLYENSNRLDLHGFNSWIGPEPHGADPNNSGYSARTKVGGRDVVYSNDVVQTIKDLDEVCNPKPWLLVASFVNPHDITLFGDGTENMPIYDFKIDDSLPYIPPPPTENEDLSTKPDAQESYKQTYPHALQPITNREKYRKLYYSLQKYVDKEICKVLNALVKSSMYENTIIIFTSDHGDQLGAHGLFQKWHNIYEESLHVPFIIHSPRLYDRYYFTDELTSHVDILPTMLELAHLDPLHLMNRLRKNHTEVHKLVGKVMSFNTHTRNSIPKSIKKSAIYFWTIDNPTKGFNQKNKFTGQPYESVVEPNSIEAIIVYLPSVNGGRHLYKYARYFDPNDDSKQQYEMYDLTNDPLEIKNLVYPTNFTEEIQHIRSILDKILLYQRKEKKLIHTQTN